MIDFEAAGGEAEGMAGVAFCVGFEAPCVCDTLFD